MGGFEHLEHTADVGIAAWDETAESVFEQATLGVLDIMGAYHPKEGERVPLDVTGRDMGSVLVEWLSEVLYMQDTKDAIVTKVEVEQVRDTLARGAIWVAPRAEEMLEGTAVKAITFHGLDIQQSEKGWTARVYVDV